MAQLRATLVSFDSGAHTAALRLDGSAPQLLEGITVARNLAAAEMTPGRRLLVESGESGELEELVVYAVYA